MNSTQTEFEAAVDLLYEAILFPESGGYNNDDWTVVETYLTQVTSVAKRYTDSQGSSKSLRPNQNFINLLVNASLYVLC
jgi:hypothetical protein